ncbi:MAG: aryl-sulfate sulfotransferase [Myxococcota bacterium]
MLGWLVACNGEPMELGAEVEIPNATAPLVRRLRAHTEVPSRISARWSDGDHEVAVAFDALEQDHEHLLLGWRPGRAYDLTVTATDEDGRAESVKLEVATATLAPHMPRAEVIGGTGARAPGHTLIPMDSTGQPAPNGIAAIFDEQGEMAYYLDLGDFVLDVIEHEGGLYALVGSADGELIHYAWDGTELESWSLNDARDPTTVVDALDALHLHHDVQPFPDDAEKFAALARFPLTVPDYPQSYVDPGDTAQTEVAIDVVVEFAADGTVLSETRLDELIPIHRIGYGSTGPEGQTADGLADWAHANAVVHDGDEYIVSLRHQDAILKIDPRAEGDARLKWILGYPDNWPADLKQKLLTPLGDLRWTYHQHGPRLTTDGPGGERRLMVFDNGNCQAAPYTDEPCELSITKLRSRVVQFSIDESAGTVRQDWAFDQPSGGTLYSSAVGEAEPLPNGNVLSVWGFLVAMPDGTPNADAGVGDTSVRIIELAPEGAHEVEQLYVTSDRAVNDKGWTGSRAERVPSLYGRVVD